ncbi:MAG: hypothetical protein ACTSRG_11525 [Candidatus Helarchaeota archaeon]
MKVWNINICITNKRFIKNLEDDPMVEDFAGDLKAYINFGLVSTILNNF